MSLSAVVLLALVQGITEFLPISSSAHLILVRVFGAEEGMATMGANAGADLVFDVALHVGTLLAVMLYARRDLWLIVRGVIGGLGGKRGEGWHLGWQLVLATIPVVVVGFLAKDLITDSARYVGLIAWTTLIFGIVLWLADRVSDRLHLSHLGYGRSLAIGVAQTLALVPGVSRSGICMTMGRFVGLNRVDAARFSLLLSIPTIIGAAVLAGVDLYRSGNVQLEYDALVGMVLSFVSAWVAILLMMRWLARASFLPFVLYRIALGLVLLAIAYA
ncbi:MAG: undecaprenyl-diphosphate phosphatase [Alphaproteobacteria bacterium]|nr:undecaprenyl-diphosphate phosphatase [Alphaproteobacteria bacterium]MCB9928066.1 undecaprenyl-diphosphate phosphatase [Alphaproteobacteria bacterium]